MELIKSFLSKYKKLTTNHNLLRDVVLDCINKKTKILIQKKDIKIVNNVVYIKTKPIVKSEIFIHKEYILNEINNILPTKTIKDIK